MTFEYSSADHRGLPNVEIWCARVWECPSCGDIPGDDEPGMEPQCPHCGRPGVLSGREGWFWQACYPGCLPDSEPNGPFDSYAEAREDALEEEEEDLCR